MKEENKKKIGKKYKLILALLLLVVTVGYAVIASNLKINGTSIFTAKTWKVVWDNVQVSTGSVSGAQVIEAATITDDEAGDPVEGTEVEYSVRLNQPGDYYEFTVDAHNKGTYDAMVTSVTNKVYDSTGETEVNPENYPYLIYTVQYATGTNKTVTVNDKLAHDSTETYKVRVEFDPNVSEANLPGTDTTLKFKFNVNYGVATSDAHDRT